MVASKDGFGWRGWAALPGAEGSSITSARLPSDAPVVNRLFPKTRSWFALGAPLELLSPLSVLRVLYAIGAIVWPAVAFSFGLPLRSAIAVGVTSAVTFGAWIWLRAVREVSLRACHVLSALGISLTGVLVFVDRTSVLAFGFATFLLTFGVCNALFLRLRSVLVHLAFAGAVLAAALALAEGPARAIVVAALVTVTSAMGVVGVFVLVRANARQGALDPDTGLPNGVGLARHFEGAARPDRLVIAAVHLDGIGEAREAFGHRVATELLRRAVEHLGQVLPPDAVIGRLDGDELVVAEAIDNPAAPGGVDAARALAGTLASSIAKGLFEVDGIEVALRAHVGLALYPEDGGEIAELVRRASLGARRAVALRRVDVHAHDDLHAMTAANLALLSDLRLAAHRDELSLVYQPQVDPSSGATMSVEALLRWSSPHNGDVSPAQFVPLAERTGLIVPLTAWVLGEALDAQVRWRTRGIEVPVSVNLSATMLTKPELSDWVLAELHKRSLPTEALAIEVTETAAAEDLLSAVDLLRPLHDLGVRISIDDFGTGYTSLSVLPQLPLDELKVDQRFVRRAPSSPADEAIVRLVRELAQRLGLTAVAEGVENEEIHRQMVSFDFDLLQGYLLARPLAENAFMCFIETTPRSLHRRVA